VTIWPGREWRNFSRRVVNYSPGAGFDFDRPFERNPNDPYHDFDPILPEEGNHYFLSGCLAALDIPTEWFLDEESGVIYLWTPDGRSPAERLVEVKQRDLAFDLRGRSHIELHGLRIFAAAVSMEGSDHCVADGCRVRYVGHFRGGGRNREAEEAACNVMTGSHNEWRNSSVAHAAGDAFRVGGEGNAITNCIIHDVNYSGGYMAAISALEGCHGAAITRNTIYNSGREIIAHLHAAALRIERNHIYNAGLLTKDNGMTKTWGTDGKGTVIAYNWVHHNHAEYGCGIYLDNFNRNFIVHHNVVWAVSDAGIRLNSDCLDNLVANNTLPGEMGFAVYNYPNYPPTQKGTRVLNNLVRGRMQFVTGENAPTTDRNGDFPVDAKLVPTADSGAVDGGIAIPGITDGFAGAAPDIGAYERGGDYWVPGADWTEEGGPPLQTPAEATAAAEKAMGAKR
jgi:hypothetical protein